MENGWIKIHRKILEKGYYKKSQYIHLWLHLLLSANHNPKEFMWNGKIITINPGQFITGRIALSLTTGIPQSTIQDILDFLEKDGEIRQQKTNKYRLITILNWKKYQNPDNKPTTSRQQADTNKNDKNDKKYITEQSSEQPFSLKEKIDILNESNRRELNIIGLYLEYRNPDIKNIEQYNLTVKRHIRSAIALKSFTNGQLIKAIEYAKKEYKDIYTLETLLKILTK